MSESTRKGDSFIMQGRTFHDGKVLGLFLPKSDECLVFLSDTSETKYQLKLSGIVGLRVNEFLRGNIVLELEVETGEQVQKERVLFALSISDEARHINYVASISDRIIKKELFLVQISPSYGCELACLCESVALQAVDESNSGVSSSTPLTLPATFVGTQ